ncbi:MAG: hypothetical protein BHV88_17920 [Clostridiales bacterium 41_12_two_minus]|nr:MAG: hypothetical protein BHV88_17920 [Clostridiales bacterium 41_12_two_minus]
MKNNVDDRMFAVAIDSRDIILYQRASKKGNKYILNQDDAVDFLNTHAYEDLGEPMFYFFYKCDRNVSFYDDMYLSNLTNDVVGSSTTKTRIVWCREYSQNNLD